MNVYLQTFGCQMNFLEAELLRGILARTGVRFVEDSRTADVALVSGCLVREHAEARAVARVKALRHEGVPRVGVLGCLARRRGGIPGADFLVSPEHYDQLASVMRDVPDNGGAFSLLAYEGRGLQGVVPREQTSLIAWVAITHGCDNFCSYCVVPYARGRESSRPTDDILDEVVMLGSSGCREVVLIGQNANSYRYGSVDFPALLRRVDELGAVDRVRFLTSHPRDMTRETLDVMAESSSICHHLHLPLQSGSDRVLDRMNRGYTVERYRAIVDTARERMPGIGISTDLMVGFPGEETEDYAATLRAVREIGFDAAFTFGYSPRPGTAAARMPVGLPRRMVGKRLRGLVSAVRRSVARRLCRRVGESAQVLVEGPSPKDAAEWVGRSREGNIVVLPREGVARGDAVWVQLRDLRGFTFGGTVTAPPSDRSHFAERTAGRAVRSPDVRAAASAFAAAGGVDRA